MRRIFSWARRFPAVARLSPPSSRSPPPRWRFSSRDGGFGGGRESRLDEGFSPDFPRYWTKISWMFYSLQIGANAKHALDILWSLTLKFRRIRVSRRRIFKQKFAVTGVNDIISIKALTCLSLSSHKLVHFVNLNSQGNFKCLVNMF